MLFGLRRSLSKGVIVLRKSPDGKEIWEKHTTSGKRILKRKPRDILLFKDALEFLKSVRVSQNLLEEYRNNPPSKRIDRLTRTRIIAYWLFSNGEPFSRKEVNRIIKVVYEKNPPLTQDIPRIAQEVLDCPLFEKVSRGYWRALRASMKTKGRPPKPGALSATERAFQLIRERRPYEYYAFIVRCLRDFLVDVVADIDLLRQKYEEATDKEKNLIIRRLSYRLDARATAISWMTDSIFIGLAVDGLITESELKEALKRFHSTTFNEFIADLIRPLTPTEERELDRTASKFQRKLARWINAWKRATQKP